MLPHRRAAFAVVFLSAVPAAAQLPRIEVERQPLEAQVQRLTDALELLGEPLSAADRKALQAAYAVKDAAAAVAAIQEVLDRRCLAAVRIADQKVTVLPGPATPELAEQGWRVFLVKVINADELAGVELRADSPNALPLTTRSTANPAPKVVSVGEVQKRFLDLMMFTSQPLVRDLSGLGLEYRLLQVYCRDAGRKEAALGFSLWRNDVKPGSPGTRLAAGEPIPVLFTSRPAVLVKLAVRDHDGRPCTGAFVFRDAHGRVYPSQSRRLAPDFNFHPQIYRADGETVLLQPGTYTVRYRRGPEYLTLERQITVPEAASHRETFELRRWIHPARRGWYSGDHHVHAAGCAHYESPTEGVTPEDMMRHILGEDLNVGCCLSWGPCWYHQKRYFEGKPNALSTPDHLLRYDVEVSGFPSSHCGHICLLRLKEQDYPGTKVIADWPSWDLPILQWAQKQGGVVGFAHSGWGLAPEKPDDPTAGQLPNYILPRMDGIGANEYLVDVAHGACDFISTVDTPATWELNIWYHTLNCGYRCRISGETDFPCIYGERVGLGRSYVHLEGKLDFDAWVEGIKNGRCYVGDGKSHLLDFAVNDLGVGQRGSELRLDRPGTVRVTATAAAWLEPEPTPETERIRRAGQPTRGKSSGETFTYKPYWDVEKARIGDSRKVPVELIVNGHAVDRTEIVADGSLQPVAFTVPLTHSSWVALRILPSSHTNPVFVVVDGKPIRASRRSAEWCLQAIDKCWDNKVKLIRESERADARAAYDQAKDTYRKVLAECVAD
jgi:hypothetical protein